jgi:hypothetical protein
MDKHYWIFAVLADVSDYAKLNGLESLKAHLDAAHEAAHSDFSELNEKNWTETIGPDPHSNIF